MGHGGGAGEDRDRQWACSTVSSVPVGRRSHPAGPGGRTPFGVGAGAGMGRHAAVVVDGDRDRERSSMGDQGRGDDIGVVLREVVPADQQVVAERDDDPQWYRPIVGERRPAGHQLVRIFARDEGHVHLSGADEAGDPLAVRSARDPRPARRQMLGEHLGDPLAEGVGGRVGFAREDQKVAFPVDRPLSVRGVGGLGHPGAGAHHDAQERATVHRFGPCHDHRFAPRLSFPVEDREG